eukprot:UN08058
MHYSSFNIYIRTKVPKKSPSQKSSGLSHEFSIKAMNQTRRLVTFGRGHKSLQFKRIC